MNTTTFIIDTVTPAFVEILKANKVPMFEDNGKYLSVVPVFKENALVDFICKIAKKTKATAGITVHYQDGSGLDQRTYNFGFINGMNEEEFAYYNEELETRIYNENEEDIERRQNYFK